MKLSRIGFKVVRIIPHFGERYFFSAWLNNGSRYFYSSPIINIKAPFCVFATLDQAKDWFSIAAYCSKEIAKEQNLYTAHHFSPTLFFTIIPCRYRKSKLQPIYFDHTHASLNEEEITAYWNLVRTDKNFRATFDVPKGTVFASAVQLITQEEWNTICQQQKDTHQ